MVFKKLDRKEVLRLADMSALTSNLPAYFGPLVACMSIALLLIGGLTFIILNDKSRISRLESQLAKTNAKVVRPPLFQESVNYTLLTQHLTPSRSGTGTDFLLVFAYPVSGNRKRVISQILSRSLYQYDPLIPVNYARFEPEMRDGTMCKVLHAHPLHLFKEKDLQQYEL